MNTSFQSGQLKFKPQSLSFQRPSASKMQASPAHNTSQSQAKSLRLQLDKIKAKLKVLEEKRKKTLSPVYRQGADAQIATLKKQLQGLFEKLATLKSQERAHQLKILTKESPIEALRSTLNGLYFRPKTFPSEQSALLIRKAVNLLINKCEGSPSDLESQNLRISEQLNSLHTLSFMSPQEHSELAKINEILSFHQRKALDITPLATPHPPEQPSKVSQGGLAPLPETSVLPSQSSSVAPASPLTFPSASAHTPASSPSVQETSALDIAPEDRGDLEVSFDFASGKSKVQNQMGIALNQPKKSYQAYLDEGFQHIDRVVQSEFKDMNPFQEAIEAFLEAVHLNKEKHEAYFGLGYLYSLVRDLNHSLYFLDIAHKISGDSSVLDFMNKVKQTYGV